MWVTPRPVGVYTKGFFWTVVEQVGCFQLLKVKTTGKFKFTYGKILIIY